MNPEGKEVVRDPNEPPPNIKVSVTRFKRHVARHQEQLAIFAMPRHFEDDHSSGSRSSRPSTLDIDEETEEENTVDVTESFLENLPDTNDNQPGEALAAETGYNAEHMVEIMEDDVQRVAETQNENDRRST
jgi:hypothetical protein